MTARRRLRTQLTLLYAVPFLVSGALLLTIPILQTRQTAPVGTVLPAEPVRVADAGDHVSRLVAVSGLGLAIMGLVSLILGWVIAGRFLHPLRTMTATARDISASNLHRRLGHTGRNDEFTELAATLDDLFARLEASFTSQRNFVANASHELRTPLTAERTLLQVALADPNATVDGLRTVCRDVLDLGVAQERLVDALLTLASSEQGLEHRTPFDLADLAAEVTASRAAEARRRGLTLTTELAPAPASGDPSLVVSLIANLVDNALRHNTSQGHLAVTTTTYDGFSRLTVSNTGAVIPPAEVDRLYEAFQRLSPQRLHAGAGHGLGLAIVRAIAAAHSATITTTPHLEGGLTIEIRFPAERP
ncbi:sensor histidine kinase [Actinoplanes friuliensis]|uniref:histidine kinase n=1 Tax=Actinoplanes friuliensis DSM 7358 TaxID=1246995 RepID=U5W8U3_9ACTN|nr:ATP-binding protein [Actinoplanes friuliensis]AGZ44415.1 histidine kinase [Actinoplanes friuliensis DSM 7358]